MKRLSLVAAAGMILTLTACALDTAAAEKTCYDYIVDRAVDEGVTADMPTEQYIDFLETAKANCAQGAKDDPEGFIEQWD